MLRRSLLILAILLAGCLTWVDPGTLDDDDTVGDDDDSAGDDDDSTGDDDDSTGDDDDSTAGDDLDGDGFTVEDGDCDDEDPAIRPDMVEACNGYDDNCDGQIDEDLPTEEYAPDADLDGWPTANQELWVEACVQPDELYPAGNAEDCADSNAAIHPAALEVCNGLDDNCDGTLDEGVQVTLYRDNDQDGWGADGSVGQGCAGPGFSTNNLDCDDSAASLNLDDADGDGISSCDGDCEDGLASVFPGSDSDNDGFTGCGQDCDDTDGGINPQASEVCDQEDQDCDGIVDEGFTSVVVIRGVDTTGADALNTMLDDAGYCVGSTMNIATLGNVNALPYQGVVMTSDTGDANGPFGDLSVLWNWYWNGSGSGTSGNSNGALVGLGAGGMAALDWLGQSSDLTWSNASMANGTEYVIRRPSNAVYSTPNWLGAQSGAIEAVTNDSGAENVLLSSDSNVTSLAWGDHSLGSTSFCFASVPAGSSGRDLWLYGNSGSYDQATTFGADLLQNLIHNAIGPP